LAAHDQNFNPYERGSERDLARHLSLLCENFHLHNLERPIRIAADLVPEERWREVEEASAEIVMRIRERLRKYVLTAWRPDAATDADECALVWSPDLPLAAEPEMYPSGLPRQSITRACRRQKSLRRLRDLRRLQETMNASSATTPTLRFCAYLYSINHRIKAGAHTTHRSSCVYPEPQEKLSTLSQVIQVLHFGDGVPSQAHTGHPL
jgi:hypothetical protein